MKTTIKPPYKSKIRLVEMQTPDSFRIHSECDSPHDTIKWRAVCVSELEPHWSLVAILNWWRHFLFCFFFALHTSFFKS